MAAPVFRETSDRYQSRVEQERNVYGNCLAVHNLPEIFTWWSNRHVQPKLRRFGLDSPNDLFRRYLEARFSGADKRPRRFISFGSGNCDLEIQLALHLNARGHSNFTIDCFDLNPLMLERGRVAAARHGVESNILFLRGDLNGWSAAEEYDTAMANQSLHHVVNLEGLFAEVKRSLRSNGTFLISDMIGRNGHQRWPEALDIVHQCWRMLPPSYRYNRQLGRYEELYENWDCSREGFEGIRAQDILPLLLEHFHFQLFLPFGNVIDPFIDRAFGHNFDASAQWDRDFIDWVHLRDDEEMRRGRITPTHMLAVLGKEEVAHTSFLENLSPGFCVRDPDAPPGFTSKAQSSAYAWHTWPHSPRRELEIACQQIAESAAMAIERTDWAQRQDEEVTHLGRALRERANDVNRLERELEERTAWALRLQGELDDQIRRAEQSESELRHYLHSPPRYVARLARALWNRLTTRLAPSMPKIRSRNRA